MQNSELPNFISILADIFSSAPWVKYLPAVENLAFSLIIVALLSVVAFSQSRRKLSGSARLANALEAFVESTENFICGILGAKGRAHTSFIGTLFIYILSMNMAGLIPFMKSSTASLSTTLALGLCVFAYVQYYAVRELKMSGYIDHLMGRPRGVVAFSLFIPVLMLAMHIVSELVRPLSLAFRLRSNIWGDDMLLSVLAGMGAQGIPLVIFSVLLAMIASVVQAFVFCILTTIYLALVLQHET
jgi:F-type H+-transporting ATPase subunit a